MFPNVRLMIAALLASVFALILGFGVFAAFRVNHEPLGRLPSASAPLQLVVGNAAPLAMTLATTGPILPIGELRGSGVAAQMPAAAAATEPATASTEQTVAAVVPPAPSEIATPTPSTGDATPDVPQQEQEKTPIAAVSAPLSSQDAPQLAALREPEHEAKSIGAVDTTAEMAPDAAKDPPPEALPVTPVTQESKPASGSAAGAAATEAGKPAPQLEAKKTEAKKADAKKAEAKQADTKKTARTRVAARTHRVRARIVAETPSIGQNVSPRPQFQTALSAYDARTQAEQAQQARSVRRVATRRTARKHSAVGGPFVRAQ